MLKTIYGVVFTFVFLFLSAGLTFAESYVSVVNPIRGDDFKENSQDIFLAVDGQKEILENSAIFATWLLRPDVYFNVSYLEKLKSLQSRHELGIFLEITPSWTKRSGVEYNKSENWHFAESVFLAGYTQDERKLLIDTAFEEFRLKFGSYPKSVGAWWVDSFSINYMQQKYGINGVLIVADQYSTDNYQVWGQYFGYPYYPSNINALFPAQSSDSKVPVVMMQWASRDPVNGYGKGVEESTLSVQANDYVDYHNLGPEYFGKLIDIYTKQNLNLINQVVVGIENSYSWEKYGDEYAKQVQELVKRRSLKQLQIVNMQRFSQIYLARFPGVSPTQVIISDDPLGSSSKSVWMMNPFYRAGWITNESGSYFRDIRQYIPGLPEMCFKVECKTINFATFPTRVLDEVTYGTSLFLDPGRVHNFEFRRVGENFRLEYLNEAERRRVIEFLPRDIAIDGVVKSIDETILQAIAKPKESDKKRLVNEEMGNFSGSIGDLGINFGRFVLAFLGLVFFPGLLVVKLLKVDSSFTVKVVLGVSIGLVFLTMIGLLAIYSKNWWMVLGYGGLASLAYLIVGVRRFRFKVTVWGVVIGLLIAVGTLFQGISVFRSGLEYQYGVGFWGPNGRDGVWHVALILQLVKSVPPESPIFAGEVLSNYHYFYDLLAAVFVKIGGVGVMDLVFRFLPMVFSLFIGLGAFCLTEVLTKRFDGKLRKVAVFSSIFLVYFAGSFGWIVDYLKNRQFWGESAFWANQPVSLNLNPPFAISLLISIGVILLVYYLILRITKKSEINLVGTYIVMAICLGSLVGFKAYSAIIMFLSIGFLSVVLFIRQRNPFLMLSLIVSGTIGYLIFKSNYSSQAVGSVFIWSPFWFIHSMVDSSDRVGWVKLSSARSAYFERGEWIKYILMEILGLGLFIAGNLGIRIVGLMMLLKSKKIFSNYFYLFLLFYTTASLLIPIFFIQSGTPWNTIQFSYYGLFMMAIVAGVSLGWAVAQLNKIGIIIVLVLLTLAPVNSIVGAYSYSPKLPQSFVSRLEVEGLKYLSVLEEGVVLTPLFNPILGEKYISPVPLFGYASTAYVSAFSGKSVWLADENQNEILGIDYKKRMVGARDFFRSNSDRSRNFLREKNIEYIYLPKEISRGLDEQALGLKLLFENDEVLIYSVERGVGKP